MEHGAPTAAGLGPSPLITRPGSTFWCVFVCVYVFVVTAIFSVSSHSKQNCFGRFGSLWVLERKVCFPGASLGGAKREKTIPAGREGRGRLPWTNTPSAIIISSPASKCNQEAAPLTPYQSFSPPSLFPSSDLPVLLSCQSVSQPASSAHVLCVPRSELTSARPCLGPSFQFPAIPAADTLPNHSRVHLGLYFSVFVDLATRLPG